VRVNSQVGGRLCRVHSSRSVFENEPRALLRVDPAELVEQRNDRQDEPDEAKR
jgi:hypothetical protein